MPAMSHCFDGLGRELKSMVPSAPGFRVGIGNDDGFFINDVGATTRFMIDGGGGSNGDDGGEGAAAAGVIGRRFDVVDDSNAFFVDPQR